MVSAIFIPRHLQLKGFYQNSEQNNNLTCPFIALLLGLYLLKLHGFRHNNEWQLQFTHLCGASSRLLSVVYTKGQSAGGLLTAVYPRINTCKSISGGHKWMDTEPNGFLADRTQWMHDHLIRDALHHHWTWPLSRLEGWVALWHIRLHRRTHLIHHCVWRPSL